MRKRGRKAKPVERIEKRKQGDIERELSEATQLIKETATIRDEKDK